MNELSSLPQRSRGVDSRSLVAKPLKITRYNVDGPERGGKNPFEQNAIRGDVQPRIINPKGQVRVKGISKGKRGGYGGSRRGGGGGRPRRDDDEYEEHDGSGRGGGESPPPVDLVDAMTPELRQWRRHFGGNFADGPHEPDVSLESLLKKHGTPTLSSAQGLLQNVAWKMSTGVDGYRKGYEVPNMHRYKLAFGAGIAVFEGTQEAKYGKDWLRNRTHSSRELRVPGGLKEFTEEDLAVLSNTWAAGHYELPKQAALDDAVGQVEAQARRNTTYLGEDARKMDKKLKSLLPTQLPQKPNPNPKAL